MKFTVPFMVRRERIWLQQSSRMGVMRSMIPVMPIYWLEGRICFPFLKISLFLIKYETRRAECMNPFLFWENNVIIGMAASERGK